MERLDSASQARAKAKVAARQAEALAGWVRELRDDLPSSFRTGNEADALVATLERIRDLTQRPDFGARRAARAVRADKSAIGMLALGIKRASPKGRNHNKQVNELIVALFGGDRLDPKPLDSYRASAAKATPGLVGDV